MRHLSIFAFLWLLLSMPILAQSSYRKALQQYSLFESERDRKGSVEKQYEYLLEAYLNYKKASLVNDGDMNAIRSRFKTMYPFLFEAAAHFLKIEDETKATQFAIAYIELPHQKIMREEVLVPNRQYYTILFMAGLGSYKLGEKKDAENYLLEYLNSAEQVHRKEVFSLLHQIYYERQDYEQQEVILKKAIESYPLCKDFHYKLINVYIAINDVKNLEKAIQSSLQVDPNDTKVLPTYAKLMEKNSAFDEALETYGRLYKLNPDNFDYLCGYARANFNKATEIINSGADLVDDNQYVIIRKRAAVYLYEAKGLFEKILEKSPLSHQYIIGLANIYQSLDFVDEFDVLREMIQRNDSFKMFPTLLAEYRERKKGNTESILPEKASTPINPAKLLLSVDDFSDNNGDKIINAEEPFKIKVSLTNSGSGTAYNVRVRLSEQAGLDRYFDGAKEFDAGTIVPGETKNYNMQYIASRNIPSAECKIGLYAFEDNGFDADPIFLTVGAQELPKSKLGIVDHQFFADNGASITLGSNAHLSVALQNRGLLSANNVRVEFSFPNNVFATDMAVQQIDSIPSGNSAIVECKFLVNKRFEGDSIAIAMKVFDPTEKVPHNEVFKVKLGSYLTAANNINISRVQNKKIVLEDVKIGYSSDLLSNIPEGKVSPHRYALIFGNENYSITGDNAEINVPFARNDAYVFREYCIRTFGIPDSQIKIVFDATTGLMHEHLDWLKNVVSADPEAEIFFYYSGHGNNDEVTKDAYLLPVDISGKNMHLGIALNTLYAQLAESKAKTAYVFLDACFSGGYKSIAPLVAQKGVRVVPKMGVAKGNVFCLSSSSGEQTSSVFPEKRQGYFTYYLLKTIQRSHGNISLKDLSRQTQEEVKRATLRINKMQEPHLQVSENIKNNWENIFLMTPKD